MEQLLRPLVWTDYRLAVLFTVMFPIVLLILSFIKKSEAVTKLLIIYWRVASLLMITVYLMIPAWPIGFLSGLAARILIPISLWFWVDLNDEIKDLPKSILKLLFTSWRWAMTIYCILGVILNLSTGFISCAFSSNVTTITKCRVWLEAPWGYKAMIHADSRPGFLGFLGMVGLVVYIVYLGYFVFIRLGKQGRTALEQ